MITGLLNWGYRLVFALPACDLKIHRHHIYAFNIYRLNTLILRALSLQAYHQIAS